MKQLLFIYTVLALAALPTSANADEFKDEILPILTKRCVRCHGEKKQNGKIRLDNLSTDLLSNARAAETWHDALNVVNLGEMPPKDEQQLTAAERAKLVNWLTKELDRVIKVRKSTGGQVVLRRLNRVEYNNTMRDLLGLDIDYAKDLPPEGLSSDGFKNNGAALRMSGLQLEYYLQSARNGLKRVIVSTPQPDVFEYAETASTRDKVNGNYTTRLGRSGVFVARIDKFPDEGEFVLRVKAHAELKPNLPFPRMQLMLGYRADTQTPSKEIATIDVASAESKTYEFRARIESFPLQSRTQSKYPGQLIWVRNIYSDGKPAPKPKTILVEQKGKKKKKKQKVYVEDPDFPKIIVESVEFVAPVFQQWPPKHHTDILAADDNSKSDERSDERSYVQQAVSRFMARAYRRPVLAGEVKQTMRFFDAVRPLCDSMESAVRETLAMVLISPEFLYLSEPSTTKRKLTDFELASRLSYFLWSTMPDEELLGLAKHGKLSNAKLLASQTSRLLNDERSWSFVEQFTDQWLDLSGVDRIAVNPEFYPKFKHTLKPELRRETEHFFAEVLSQNLSALELIQTDFTMLNQPLAEHYGIAGPLGTAFQRVALTDKRRQGGLLSHGSVLLANSTGEDSHAIKRGVWIRERLLDDPPAPPPPNVPDLNKKNGDVANLSLRDQLIQHRENAACANCHKDIDPWGLAMEDFDGVGLFRESVKRRGTKKSKQTFPVNAATVLPSGVEIDGLEELKSYLKQHKQSEFARALTVKLLTYALGRTLEFTDDPLVDELTQGFIESDYKLQTLIRLIVQSESFRSK